MNKRIIVIDRCGNCPYMDAEIFGNEMYEKCTREHGRIIDARIPDWCTLQQCVEQIDSILSQKGKA